MGSVRSDAHVLLVVGETHGCGFEKIEAEEKARLVDAAHFRTERADLIARIRTDS